MHGAEGAKRVDVMDRDQSELELAIWTMVKNYDKYATRNLAFWRERHISKKGFREMLRQELSHMLTDTQYKTAADKLFHELDQDGDDSLNFEEYWNLMGKIVAVAVRIYHQQKEIEK